MKTWLLFLIKEFHHLLLLSLPYQKPILYLLFNYKEGIWILCLWKKSGLYIVYKMHGHNLIIHIQSFLLSIYYTQVLNMTSSLHRILLTFIIYFPLQILILVLLCLDIHLYLLAFKNVILFKLLLLFILFQYQILNQFN
jgi:hypothetical protein